ncbi:unnamed protein product [Rotaria sordida]|uniref:Uncharacterized protein n=2 Tax=Rotaria sordida TaxID=392033 RepID=A0A814FV97_9BILA|nr:unnamed protein product [Rotaria sordida]
MLIKLALPNIFNNFVWSTRQDQENSTIDDIIGLKVEDDIDQGQQLTLEKIIASGIVPGDFHYRPNPYAFTNHETFLAYVSNIDRNNYTIYMQPECHMQNMQELTEDLDFYYSNPITDNLLVKKITIDLAYLGITEEVQMVEGQFKFLLKYFARLPCLAIPCRLIDSDFKLVSYQMPPETYKQLNNLCQTGPFSVESHGQVNGMLNVKIFDGDYRCLNDIAVQNRLAFSSSLEVKSTIPPTIVTKNHEDQR